MTAPNQKFLSVPFTLKNWLPPWFGNQYRKVIFSTRIRYARNISEFKFPQFAKPKTRQYIYNSILKAVGEDGLQIIGLFDLNRRYLELLEERHLINTQPIPESYLMLDENELISLLINQEDHLRIQSLQPGFEPEQALAVADYWDHKLNKSLKFAGNSKWGYLTSCPTNLGTGLRLSFLVHIPGLFLTGELNKVKAAADQCRLAIRGLFGEGTKAIGSFCQISNQKTFGPVGVIIDQVNKFMIKLADYEWFARERIVRYNKQFLTDRINKQMEKLLNYKLSHFVSTMPNFKGIQELAKNLSMIKLGFDLGIQDQLDDKKITYLLFFCKPRHLELLNEKYTTHSFSDLLNSYYQYEEFTHAQG
ncbi:MAG: hypothetical protein ACP5FK_05825 [bacterium]